MFLSNQFFSHCFSKRAFCESIGPVSGFCERGRGWKQKLSGFFENFLFSRLFHTSFVLLDFFRRWSVFQDGHIDLSAFPQQKNRRGNVFSKINDYCMIIAFSCNVLQKSVVLFLCNRPDIFGYENRRDVMKRSCLMDKRGQQSSCIFFFLSEMIKEISQISGVFYCKERFESRAGFQIEI